MTIEEIKAQLSNGSLKRKNIRYRLFRIRDNNHNDVDLKKYIESQFKTGMNWSNFTFDWDVAPDDPLKVIEPFEWVLCGGKHDLFGCSPPAFTRQE